MIETLDDIIEEIADRVGVFGARDHVNDAPDFVCPCRNCFTSPLRDRITKAVAVGNALSMDVDTAPRFACGVVKYGLRDDGVLVVSAETIETDFIEQRFRARFPLSVEDRAALRALVGEDMTQFIEQKTQELARR